MREETQFKWAIGLMFAMLVFLGIDAYQNTQQNNRIEVLETDFNIIQHGGISPDYVVIGTSDSYSPMENNIMVGEYAGWNLIKGKCNLFLGKDSGAGVMESNNKIYLESGTYDITCEEVELLRKVLTDK